MKNSSQRNDDARLFRVILFYLGAVFVPRLVLLWIICEHWGDLFGD